MRLVWCDLETTGLDERKNQILEIGISITDEHGQLLDIPAVLTGGFRNVAGVISSPVKMVTNEELDPFIQKMHTDNGLLNELAAGAGLYPQALETYVVQMIKSVCPEKDETFLAGNSLSLDKNFLRRYMPAVLATMGYRLFDMSSVAEFFRSLGEPRPSGDPARRPHRVTEDICWSKELFAHYRSLALHGVISCNPPNHRQLSLFAGEM